MSSTEWVEGCSLRLDIITSANLHHRYRAEAIYASPALCPSKDPTLPASVLIATRRVLNGRVRPGKDERLMPVVAANQIRRGAVLAADLDDHRRLIRGTHRPAVYVQPVTNLCLHPRLHPRVAPSMHPPAHVVEAIQRADFQSKWAAPHRPGRKPRTS